MRVAAGGRPRLIWLAEVPFAGPPHRQPILAQKLAARFDVLYIEPPPPRRAPAVRVTECAGVHVAQAAPIVNAHPWPLRLALRARALRGAAQRVATYQVRRAVERLGWRTDELLLICSNVYFAGALDGLRGRVRMLDLCDDPRYYPGEPTWVDALLRAAAARVDAATTSSRLLAQELRDLGIARVSYVPNGIDEALLSAAASRPRRSSPGQVVGFLGHIGAWVNLGLIEQLAAALPGTCVRLVGSVDPVQHSALASLRRHANVEYLPAVPYAAVADVLATFDVGIIPFVLSPYTRAVNPLKLYEYAAFDLPVVSTPFSPDVVCFDGAIDLAATPEQFVTRVRQRLVEHDAPSTRWIAQAHTWEGAAATLAELLEAACLT